MALYVRNICQIFRQEPIKVLIQKRFLARLISPAHETLLAKSTKPSFIQWNSTLGLKNGTPMYLSNAEFHHLAEHTMICNIAYFINFGRNFAKATGQDGPKLGSRAPSIGFNAYDASARLALEKQRLRNKGAMKNIPTKVPETADTHKHR